MESAGNCKYCKKSFAHKASIYNHEKICCAKTLYKKYKKIKLDNIKLTIIIMELEKLVLARCKCDIQDIII